MKLFVCFSLKTGHALSRLQPMNCVPLVHTYVESVWVRARFTSIQPNLHVRSCDKSAFREQERQRESGACYFIHAMFSIYSQSWKRNWFISILSPTRFLIKNPLVSRQVGIFTICGWIIWRRKGMQGVAALWHHKQGLFSLTLYRFYLKALSTWLALEHCVYCDVGATVHWTLGIRRVFGAINLQFFLGDYGLALLVVATSRGHLLFCRFRACAPLKIVAV